MLGIVIPPKSKAVSTDWGNVTQSLMRTLRSIDGQDCERFRAVVVGHEKPDGFPDHVARFHRLEIPIPALSEKDDFRKRDQFDRILDKNRKITRGVQLLSKTPGITHWFYLDADDLLASNFVSTALAVEKAGAIIDSGVTIRIDRGIVYFENELAQVCGSTCVLSNQVMQIGDGLEENAVNSIPWCQYSHSQMDRFFDRERLEFDRLAAGPLVGYVVGHGDNCSDEFRSGIIPVIRSRIKALMKGKRFDQDLKALFSYE